MRQKISKCLTFAAKAAVAVALTFAGVYRVANATTIEGYTPQGEFQTVGVSSTGRLLIDLSTSAIIHVVVDTGTIVVSAAVSTQPFTAQGTLGVAAAVFYPADSMRKQGFFCNTSTSENMWVGGPGVTILTGNLVFPGACATPDVPTVYIGALSAVSTTTTGTWSYFYTR